MRQERYVHTNLGKAKVNWYREGRLGVSYLETGHPSDANVLNETQVEFRYGKFPEDEAKADVRKEDTQTLKDRLKALRRDVREHSKQKRRQTVKRKKEPKDPRKRLKSMSLEDKKLLLEMLKEEN